MTDGIALLPLETEHLNRVAQIEKECFGEPWSADAFEPCIGSPLYDFLVAVDTENGQVCGYGGIYTVIDCADITNIAVCDRYRRRGIASLIMNGLILTARKKGALRLQLEVRVSNLAAIALYRSFGFSEDGIRKNYYKKPVEDALLMSRAIIGSEDD